MPEPVAISLKDVSKVYRLYDSLTEQALDVLGLARLRFWRRLRYREHAALRNLKLEIRRGERVGILGRNGAGKTTLLKLITGNFAPTAGEIKLSGKVQALMNVGLGFHPEFTGYDNIQVSLAYNGLQRDELARAVQEVIDFVELGDFLHQPMKTYSLGMQARIMFATATAIRPDTLIVDEVLGAGDAYFSAKSALRMRRLASSGCTLLLVSHSMPQVLEFCERAVWLEAGAVVMDGDALSVVKAYEQYIDRLQAASGSGTASASESLLDKPWFRENILEEVLHGKQDGALADPEGTLARGGASRWSGSQELRIASVRLMDGSGNDRMTFETGEPLRIRVIMEAGESGRFPCRIAILLFTADGKALCRCLSETEEYVLDKGDSAARELFFPELCLGNGEFIFSVAIFRSYDPRRPHEAMRYDLLSRSFTFRVRDRIPSDPSLFHHPAQWVAVESAAVEKEGGTGS